MKPARTLVLRREMLTDLADDDLRLVAAAAGTQDCDLVSDVVDCTLYCPATLRPFLCGQPSESPLCLTTQR